MGAIQNAAAKGDTKQVLDLLAKGVDINDPGDSDKYGTPLHHAAYGGHLDLMKTLIERGANVNAKDSLDNTPLALAAQQEHVQAVEVLLQHRADANIATMNGETAFHDAVLAGNLEIVSLILSHGGKADVKGKKVTGDIIPSPREYAQEHGTPEMKRLLHEGPSASRPSCNPVQGQASSVSGKKWWQFWK